MKKTKFAAKWIAAPLVVTAFVVGSLSGAAQANTDHANVQAHDTGWFHVSPMDTGWF